MPNGVALCKLHHAAYDANLLGVRPDLQIEVSRLVLEEEDGPMLRHGLQGIHGQELHVPRQSSPSDDSGNALLIAILIFRSFCRWPRQLSSRESMTASFTASAFFSSLPRLS